MPATAAPASVEIPRVTPIIEASVSSVGGRIPFPALLQRTKV
jgi:hypothetical protein